jgi:TonB-dependent receptor
MRPLGICGWHGGITAGALLVGTLLLGIRAADAQIEDDIGEVEASPEVEVIQITGQRSKSSDSSQLLERQFGDTLQDTIGAEAIARSPDSDAAEIVLRIPSVTVKDSKFIYVRGLGERYSSALLGKSRLPSTDPNKRVAPLDLFPAEFIQSISIIKSYAPDLPGDFSGGLVDIDLKSYPSDLSMKLGVSLGGNTQTTFQNFEVYQGCGAADYFGFGGCRDLPGAFGRKSIGSPDPAESAYYSSTMPDVWSPRNSTAPVDTDLKFAIGNSWGDFGANLSVNWKNGYDFVPDRLQRQFTRGGVDADGKVIMVEQDNFLYDISAFETQLSALFTGGYEISETDEIGVRALYNRTSTDSVEVGTGRNEQNYESLTRVTRFQYTEESLAYGQLAGKHQIFGEGEFDWRTAYSNSSQNTPDTRTTTYQCDAEETDTNNFPVDCEDPARFTDNSQGGTRVYYKLDEWMTDTAFDIRLPFEIPVMGDDMTMPLEFSMGPAYTYRERDSNLRRFLYLLRGVQDRTLPAEDLLTPEQILDRKVTFQEKTQLRDSFEASEEIIGGYVNFEVPLYSDILRLNAGVRTEYSYIKVEATTITGDPVRPRLNNLDPLPAVSAVWNPIEDMNVRASWAKTVSRPEFRELSPVEFPEPDGLRTTIGNPFLVESHIDSFDIRWEWFFESTEMVSLGFFHKQLEKPIEKILISQASNIANSFANAKDADLTGIEGEIRKNFGFLSEVLDPLSLTVNFAWVTSSVRQEQDAAGVQNKGTRALQGQAPFVVNASVEWFDDEWGMVRLLYNTSGREISDIGFNELPDIYLERRDQLDFVYLQTFEAFEEFFSMKFTVENLMDTPYVWTQGDFTQKRFNNGVTFKLGVSWEY